MRNPDIQKSSTQIHFHSTPLSSFSYFCFLASINVPYPGNVRLSVSVPQRASTICASLIEIAELHDDLDPREDTGGSVFQSEIFKAARCCFNMLSSDNCEISLEIVLGFKNASSIQVSRFSIVIQSSDWW